MRWKQSKSHERHVDSYWATGLNNRLFLAGTETHCVWKWVRKVGGGVFSRHWDIRNETALITKQPYKYSPCTLEVGGGVREVTRAWVKEQREKTRPADELLVRPDWGLKDRPVEGRSHDYYWFRSRLEEVSSTARTHTDFPDLDMT